MSISGTEYALLAANVYGLSDLNDTPAAVRSQQNTLPLPAGWARLDAFVRDDNDLADSANEGFLAGVYQRGTEVAPEIRTGG